MDLQRLRYFIVVAEERHITRAAARLGMAQPPLSQQIRILEKELGTRLFDRLPRGVALTPAGEVLLEDARALLDAADRVSQRARRVGAGAEGELVGGFTTSAALHPLVPRLLRTFHQAHPAISFDLHESNAAELTEGVLTQRLDFAIVRAPVSRPSTLSFIDLGSERLLLALPSNHHFSLSKSRSGIAKIEIASLADQNFILVRRRAAPGLYANIIEACRLSGFEPRIVAEVGRMLTNLNLVAAGIGISCVPESMCQIGNFGVVYAIPQAPPAARDLLRAPMTLVYRANESSPAVRSFLADAKRLAATYSPTAK
jgi:DNA-binding transcriptional LysR family regulator